MCAPAIPVGTHTSGSQQPWMTEQCSNFLNCPEIINLSVASGNTFIDKKLDLLMKLMSLTSLGDPSRPQHANGYGYGESGWHTLLIHHHRVITMKSSSGERQLTIE